MQLTSRDVRLLKDVALSHLLSRDQVIALGYFGSVSRANTRLLALVNLGLVRRLTTPFYAQSLYAVTPKASPVLGERIARLVAARAPSPRFVQHALSVTNVRLALLRQGATGWRFEPQLHTTVRISGAEYAVRPDGLALLPDGPTAVEVDLGHVAPEKFRQKLLAYDAFAASGEACSQWQTDRLSVLVVTSGRRRAAHLTRLAPAAASFRLVVRTFDELGVLQVASWS